MGEVTHVHLCFFKGVYLVEHLLEDLVACGTEIFTARAFRNCAKCRFVNYHFLWCEYHTAKLVEHGRRSLAVGADADSVDFNAEFLGHACGVERRDYSGVVAAVGQQNYTFALCFAFLKAVERSGYAVADGCSVLKHVHVDGVDVAEQLRPVYCHGHPRQAFSGEYDDADVVVFAAAHEFCRHGFGGLEAVGVEVPREHARRYVQGYHDVCAFGVCGAPVVLELRSCKHYYEASHGCESESEKQMAHILPP